MTNFNSNYLHTTPFSDNTWLIALAADTALTVTIPGTSKDLYRANFSINITTDVWVGYNTTAIIPTPGSIVTNSNVSIERNPDFRFVRGGDTVSFISSTIVGNIGLSLLRLPG